MGSILRGMIKKGETEEGRNRPSLRGAEGKGINGVTGWKKCMKRGKEIVR